jgi:hypothetical protein
MIKFLQTEENLSMSEDITFSYTIAGQKCYKDIESLFFRASQSSDGEYRLPVNIVRPPDVPMSSFEISFTCDCEVEAIFQCEFVEHE